VARIVAHLPRAPASWIVAGGGARNPTLMRNAGGAARAGIRRVSPCCRLVDRYTGGASFRLSRSAQPAPCRSHFPARLARRVRWPAACWRSR